MKAAATPTPVPWLETLRLELREFATSDFEDLYRLDSDPRVMKYINGGRALSRANVRDTLARVLRYYAHHHGLGVWRAADRDGGRFVGWFCLKYCPPTCDIEVGYRLVPEAWGRGYATEGAAALLSYGFGDLGLERIVGITHAANVASQRVLLKCGLADEGWGRYYNRRVRVFAAERA